MIDGDTFEVSPKWMFDGIQGTRVRIANFGALELDTSAGELAKQMLEGAIGGRSVVLQGRATSYGRLVADVYLEGTSVATLL